MFWHGICLIYFVVSQQRFLILGGIRISNEKNAIKRSFLFLIRLLQP